MNTNDLVHMLDVVKFARERLGLDADERQAAVLGLHRTGAFFRGLVGQDTQDIFGRLTPAARFAGQRGAGGFVSSEVQALSAVRRPGACMSTSQR